MWKANLRQGGKELTVYFNVTGRRHSCCERQGCEEANQSGSVTIESIFCGTEVISNANGLWTAIQSRLNNLFNHNFCLEHLYAESDRRNIDLT